MPKALDTEAGEAAVVVVTAAVVVVTTAVDPAAEAGMPAAP